jgi:serine O-acetyltransferase
MKISAGREVIEKDIERWIQETGSDKYSNLPTWRHLIWLLWRYPEFRNLFYYRVERDRRITIRILSEMAKFFYKPMNTLYIMTPVIGDGLFIQHGFSTIISAKSIGQNCWINQQVSIGYTNLTDTPTIGNNVRITAGAKVFGDITIGDDSVIGANAVVCKNVPPNCTVVGVPAKIVKCDGVKVNKSL